MGSRKVPHVRKVVAGWAAGLCLVKGKLSLVVEGRQIETFSKQ